MSDFDKWFGAAAPVGPSAPSDFQAWFSEAPAAGNSEAIPLPGMAASGQIYPPTGHLSEQAQPGFDLPRTGVDISARDMGRMAVQTAAAVPGSSVGGPLGAGGAAMAAGLLYDAALDAALGTRTEPSATGAALDFAGGAAAPVVSAVARPVTRALMGGQGAIDDVNRVIFDRAMTGPIGVKPTARDAVERHVGSGVATHAGAGVAAGALTGDIATGGALFFGLQGLRGARRVLARRLLSDEMVRAWVNGRQASFGTAAEAAASLGALAGANWLSADEREAFADLQQAVLSSDKAARLQANRTLTVSPDTHYLRESGGGVHGRASVMQVWDRRSNRPVRRATDADITALGE